MFLRSSISRVLKSSLSASRASFSSSSSQKICDPALVVFDKDGTLIDFNLMWGGWIESQAWKLEMTTQLPVREKLFDIMGYDWIRRSIRSKGALCCTPMGQLYQLAIQVLAGEGIAPDRASEIIAQVWALPDPIATSRPLGDIPALFQSLQRMSIKIAICTTDNRESTIGTLEHLGVMDMVDAIACGDDGLPGKLKLLVIDRLRLTCYLR